MSPSLNLDRPACPCMMSAVGLLCRIMFMRARPLVAASFWVVQGDLGAAHPPPSTAASRARWGHTVVALVVLALRMPRILRITRLTSAGV